MTTTKQNPPRVLPGSVEQALLKYSRGRSITPLSYFGSEQFAFLFVQQDGVERRLAVQQGRVQFEDVVHPYN